MPWNHGQKHTEEFKRKLRIRMKGNTFSLGRKDSVETKEKRASKLRGRKYPGRKQTELHNKRIGLSKLGKKRKPFSKEWRENMGRSRIGVFRGEKSSSWKGGVTNLRHLIRSSFKYRQWRSDCFTRDEFTCGACGKKGGKLQVDHFPKTFKEIFHGYNLISLEEAYSCEELWNINNGRTLCIDCHKKTETWGNPKKHA
jgi:5-methylcytosine-specific restriction endonuclease McrA